MEKKTETNDKIFYFDSLCYFLINVLSLKFMFSLLRLLSLHIPICGLQNHTNNRIWRLLRNSRCMMRSSGTIGALDVQSHGAKDDLPFLLKAPMKPPLSSPLKPTKFASENINIDKVYWWVQHMSCTHLHYFVPKNSQDFEKVFYVLRACWNHFRSLFQNMKNFWKCY